MARIAKMLGAETGVVRVDLHDPGDRIVFGEPTHTPSAGMDVADPAFERMLGAFWTGGR